MASQICEAKKVRAGVYTLPEELQQNSLFISSEFNEFVQRFRARKSPRDCLRFILNYHQISSGNGERRP